MTPPLNEFIRNFVFKNKTYSFTRESWRIWSVGDKYSSEKCIRQDLIKRTCIIHKECNDLLCRDDFWHDSMGHCPPITINCLHKKMDVGSQLIFRRPGKVFTLFNSDDSRRESFSRVYLFGSYTRLNTHKDLHISLWLLLYSNK